MVTTTQNHSWCSRWLRFSGRSGGPRAPRRWRPLYQAPVRLLLLLMLAIYFSETCIMLLLPLFPPVPPSSAALLDSALLLLILSPIFYFLLYRPFMCHLRQQQQCRQDIHVLSRRLMTATEAERKKVAMDLHDHFGQIITGLRFGLESLQSSLGEKGRQENPRIGTLMASVQQLVIDFRRYSSGLWPTLMDDLGLVAALEWHLGELGREHPDLRIEFRQFGIKRQPTPAIAEVLFRICQESLNNVIKHAQARQVEIVLVFCHPHYILTIVDDGIGFAPNQPVSHGGIGFWSMSERAALAGGAVRIESRPGGGTMVRAELPFTEAVDE